MPHTHADRAAEARRQMADDAAFSGWPARVDPINEKAGWEIAARHNRLLLMVCLEAGSGVAERLEEDLEESLCAGDIGLDGIAAYWDARETVASLDQQASGLMQALFAIEQFARAARRITERRAFA
jgi:hypothetical protein